MIVQARSPRSSRDAVAWCSSCSTRLTSGSPRAAYGTLLARADISLAQAQKLMRHSTPTLTANVYVKLQMDDAREAVSKLNVVPASRTAHDPTTQAESA